MELERLLRESPAPLPPEVAVHALRAHLEIALGLSKQLDEPKLTSGIYELLASAAGIKSHSSADSDSSSADSNPVA